jgi:hypothetical protein
MSNSRVAGIEKINTNIYCNCGSYMLLSRHQNAGQSYDIANRRFENVAKLRYLGSTITNQNLIQEEIERRLNSGNAC